MTGERTGTAVDWVDPRGDPEAFARSRSISREAADLHLSSDVIDLHVDSFIWTRILGYDLRKRHGRGALGARFYSQVDFPRLLEAGVTGAAWVITTNPLRTSAGRAKAFFRNLVHLQAVLRSAPDALEIVRTAAEYRNARERGLHGAFVAIQGGNALDHDLSDYRKIPPGLVSRVTLVHLSSSSLGSTSSPMKARDEGLTAKGHDLVHVLNELRIFVDLAHVSKRGFWDAVKAHDPTLPLIVTHTGVSGVHEHWRNLDDDQIRAVAKSGGTVGIMYQSSFLGDAYWGGRAESIVRHLEHVVNVAGEDHASLGSDWDGAIITPRDLQTVSELPKLVQMLLDRGHSPERIRKILGGNYLRALAALRG
ncbi:MAG TPA: membrane dipeptidase [Polyangiaceae bacterium]|nr:membrane dipeptidase [Polyangiaceae bacterium]